MQGKFTRLSKQEYYMNITRNISLRSNCISFKIGAIIVKDDQIVSTGYNGAPRKTKDCFEHGSCLRREMGIPSGHRYELCRTVHAEQNAIINAARAGVSILGGTMYMYGERYYESDKPIPGDSVPCFICKKMLINAGLKNVICHMKDGSVKEFSIKAWADEWREKDMTDDVMCYDTDYTKVNKKNK